MSINYTYQYNKQKGISIFEFLIAMSLFIGLITGAMSYFLIYNKNVLDVLNQHHKIDTVHEGLYLISEKFEVAGFTGCAGVYSQAKRHVFNPQFPPAFAIQTESGNWQPRIDNQFIDNRFIDNRFNDNNQIHAKQNRPTSIIIQTSQQSPIKIHRVLAKDTLSVQNGQDLKINDWLWLTNCQYSSLAKIIDIEQNATLNTLIKINLFATQTFNNEPIDFQLMPQDFLYKINWHQFWLAPDRNNKNISTLYLKTNQKPAVPLLANLDEFQATYLTHKASIIMRLSAALKDEALSDNQNSIINHNEEKYSAHRLVQIENLK